MAGRDSRSLLVGRRASAVARYELEGDAPGPRDVLTRLAPTPAMLIAQFAPLLGDAELDEGNIYEALIEGAASFAKLADLPERIDGLSIVTPPAVSVTWWFTRGRSLRLVAPPRQPILGSGTA